MVGGRWSVAHESAEFTQLEGALWSLVAKAIKIGILPLKKVHARLCAMAHCKSANRCGKAM